MLFWIVVAFGVVCVVVVAIKLYKDRKSNQRSDLSQMVQLHELTQRLDEIAKDLGKSAETIRKSTHGHERPIH